MKLRKFFMLCFVFIFTLTIVNGCSSSQSSTAVKNGKASSASKNVEIEVENVEYVLPLNGLTGGISKEKVLKYKVSVKNKGEKKLEISPYLFTLYQGDEKMKKYDKADLDKLRLIELEPGKKVSGTLYYEVNKASSYELVYSNEETKKRDEETEKVSFKIDTKEIEKNTKDLNKPAEALKAYINAIYYDKDIDKINKLSGEDSKQFTKNILKEFKKDATSSTNNKISDQEFESYYKKLKSVLQEKVTFKVKSVGSSPEEDKVEVELKVKPLLLIELQPKLNKENERLLKENPGIEQSKLFSQSFDYLISILPEAKVSDKEKVIKVEMERYGKDQWRFSKDKVRDAEDIMEIMGEFLKQ
ncbi:DUF5105 domain-containing protein [Bacillus pseudomycoides]|uniref:DUF5105 domain-containing protein n=1 Tax=Bacillus pseudomycoides TaxID=64104 RepID=UPI000BFDFF05|nr:DUF5105 domain-containing protein [Bacillus pseudomycoides]PHA39740.1 DUF5105 domain-containing protein [Bacillus pseudomycoides]